MAGATAQPVIIARRRPTSQLTVSHPANERSAQSSRSALPFRQRRRPRCRSTHCSSRTRHGELTSAADTSPPVSVSAAHVDLVDQRGQPSLRLTQRLNSNYSPFVRKSCRTLLTCVSNAVKISSVFYFAIFCKLAIPRRLVIRPLSRYHAPFRQF